MWYNCRKILYTLRHKMAYISTAKKCRGYNKVSDYLHDVDKLIYLIIGIPARVASKWHRRYSRHHMQNGVIRDLSGAVIDFECARITKPDKPLNARDTLKKYYPSIAEEGLDICDKWNI